MTPRKKKIPTPVLTKVVKFEESMVIPLESDMPDEKEIQTAFRKLRTYSLAEMEDVVNYLKEIFEMHALWARPLLMKKLLK